MLKNIQGDVPSGRVVLFDFVRNAAMVSVVLYHCAAAYSGQAPWWNIHDGSSPLADLIRQILDVFIMPVFFLIAGYFALASLKKKGLTHFVFDKTKRLALPWLLMLLTVIPILGFLSQMRSSGAGERNFLGYWIDEYLRTFGTFDLGMLPQGKPNQMHFWYLSLLFSFFILFGLGRLVLQRSCGSLFLNRPKRQDSAVTILKALCVFGFLIASVYFLALLLFPDPAWVTIGLLLQFQPTKVGLYAAYFGLGVYAYSRGWFDAAFFRGRPGIWLLVSGLLSVGYLFVGRDVFVHPENSMELAIPLLGAYAIVRSFLSLAIVGTLLSIAARYFDRTFEINRKLAAASFTMYMVHLFFVLILQGMLMAWEAGPALAKMGIVFLLATSLSYGSSVLINRFPRGFSVGLMLVFVAFAITFR